MNSASNVMNESPVQATTMAPSTVPWSRQMYWCVRRELWESKSIYMAPIMAAVITLVACSISAMRLPERMRAATALDPMQQMAIIEGPFDLASLLIMGVTFLVALFYSLDALHGERRDRSILFWKSLPVSDLTTVLAKASIPILVLPMLTFGVTIVTQTIVLMVSRAVLAGSGVHAEAVWGHFSFWHMEGMLLYHLVAIHGLLYSPFYGWLMLVSAWAKRLPILWATLPPIAVGLFEKVAFNTSYFASWLQNALGGGSERAAPSGNTMSMDSLTSPWPGDFLTNPQVWINLLIAALFFALAVRLRRQRGPI
jgi:ABC-2 type transport system permease protein